MLDERKVKPLSFGERRAAEMAMHVRDAREGMKTVGRGCGVMGKAGGTGSSGSRGPRALQV